MSAEQLLEYIQRTNPEMTMECMIYELSQCEYVAKAVIFTAQNQVKNNSKKLLTNRVTGCIILT